MNRLLKHVRKVMKRSPGWTPKQTGSGHIKWSHTDGAICITSLTPSVRCWEKQTIRLFKRTLERNK